MPASGKTGAAPYAGTAPLVVCVGCGAGPYIGTAVGSGTVPDDDALLVVEVVPDDEADEDDELEGGEFVSPPHAAAVVSPTKSTAARLSGLVSADAVAVVSGVAAPQNGHAASPALM